MALTQNKNVADRIQICNVEIWNMQKLSMLKARGFLYIILYSKYMKYQKQTIAAALNGGRCPYVSTYCLGNIVDISSAELYCKFGIIHRSWIKFMYWNFFGVPIMNFVPNWESQIVNQPSNQKNSSENQCYRAKVGAL